MLPHNCNKYKNEEKKMHCRHLLKLKSIRIHNHYLNQEFCQTYVGFFAIFHLRDPVFGNGNNNGADQSGLVLDLISKIFKGKKESLTTTDFS